MDLPFARAHQLPGWLPDETVFSWASRYHCLAGNRLPEETCFALFGHRRHGAQHDLPSRLMHLSEQADGWLGEAEEICLAHTLLRYYLVTRQSEEIAAAIKSLVGIESGVLKFRLGILTSRFRANHPLKACPICIRSDAAKWGSPYWHLSHQYPGRWTCEQHGSALQTSTVKSNGVQRFGWVLPQRAGLVDVVPSSSRTALQRFSSLIVGWTALSPGALSTSGIAAACRRQLQRSEIWRAGPSRAAAGASFSASIRKLRVVPELHGLPSTREQGKAELDRWVFAPRGGTHPLRHLAIIYWLFPSWQQFVEAYAEDEIPVRPAAPEAPASDDRRLTFSAAIANGRSISAASKLVGVTTSTGVAWATQQGIEAGRRPKSLSTALRASIVADLARGDEKSAIAELHQVTLQSVTRVLRSEVGLVDRRSGAMNDRARRKAQEAWTCALDAWPGAGVALLRNRAGAAYAWLRRHDKAWLDAHLPSRVHRVQPSHRVDWDRRDVELATSVRKAAAALEQTQPGRRLRPWQIFQALPELKAKQSALIRLPLTTAALAEVTQRFRQDPRQRKL